MRKKMTLAWLFLGVALLLAGLATQEWGPWATAGGHKNTPQAVTVPKTKRFAVALGPYRFIAFGDWGAGTPFQHDVAAQINALYQKKPFDAALLLGDNFYPDGNVRKLGKTLFTDMYAPLLKGHVNFIVALGNHDEVAGHQKDQIQFFGMPGYYYQVSKPKLDILVIDSNTFSKDEVQRKWLETALGKSKADWKIVMGHHPIYTSGQHGFNRHLQKSLEPLLIQYRVDFYLAGHDHDYERFSPIQGVQHIVSGGGGAYLRDFEKPMPHSVVRVKANHFLEFELDKQALKMWAIDKTGHTIDQAEWKKETKAEVPAKAG